MREEAAGIEDVRTEEDAPEEGRGSRIETITVIGSSEAADIMPGSGQYLDRQAVHGMGQDDVLRILSQVPGVYLRQEDGNGLFPNISLRGVDGTRSAKVTIMEDGILAAPAPYSAPAAYYAPSAGRMDGMEVLKGSSQIRSGPHTTGGVLNYISTRITDEPAVHGKLVYGGDRETRLRTYASNTFETESAGRFGLLAELYLWRSSGYKQIDPAPDFTDSGNTGFTTIEPMVKLMWEPPTELYQQVDVKFGYTNSDALETYLGLSEDDFDADPLRRYTTTRFDEITREHWRVSGGHTISFDPVQTGVGSVDLNTRGYYSNFARNWAKLDALEAADIDGDGVPDAGETAELARALAGDGTRDPSTGLLTPGTEGMPLEVLRGERAGTLSLRNNNRDYALWGVQQTLSLPFDTGAAGHTIEAGWRFHRDEVRRFQRDEMLQFGDDGTLVGLDPGTPGDGGNRYQRTEALALYIEDELAIGDVILRPGLRYERLWQTAVDYLPDSTNTVTRSGTNEFDLFGGGIGATWALAEPVVLFAGVHSGFSPPNPRAAVFGDVTEERSIASEAGGRFSFTDWQIEAELVGFFTRFNDLIVIDSIGGAGTGNAENVGEVNSGGIESRVEWDPATAFDAPIRTPISISYTYTNSTLASDARSEDPESIFSGGEQGNRVPYIPEHMLSVGLGLEWWRLGVGLDMTYQTRVFSTASNTTEQVSPDGIPDSRFGTVPANVIADLIAWGYVDPDERVKLMFGVQNLTDSQRRVSRHPIGPRVNKPRWIYGGVQLDF